MDTSPDGFGLRIAALEEALAAFTPSPDEGPATGSRWPRASLRRCHTEVHTKAEGPTMPVFPSGSTLHHGYQGTHDGEQLDCPIIQANDDQWQSTPRVREINAALEQFRTQTNTALPGHVHQCAYRDRHIARVLVDLQAQLSAIDTATSELGDMFIKATRQVSAFNTEVADVAALQQDIKRTCASNVCSMNLPDISSGFSFNVDFNRCVDDMGLKLPAVRDRLLNIRSSLMQRQRPGDENNGELPIKIRANRGNVKLCNHAKAVAFFAWVGALQTKYSGTRLNQAATSETVLNPFNSFEHNFITPSHSCPATYTSPGTPTMATGMHPQTSLQVNKFASVGTPPLALPPQHTISSPSPWVSDRSFSKEPCGLETEGNTSSPEVVPELVGDDDMEGGQFGQRESFAEGQTDEMPPKQLRCLLSEELLRVTGEARGTLQEVAAELLEGSLAEQRTYVDAVVADLRKDIATELQSAIEVLREQMDHTVTIHSSTQSGPCPEQVMHEHKEKEALLAQLENRIVKLESGMVPGARYGALPSDAFPGRSTVTPIGDTTVDVATTPEAKKWRSSSTSGGGQMSWVPSCARRNRTPMGGFFGNSSSGDRTQGGRPGARDGQVTASILI